MKKGKVNSKTLINFIKEWTNILSPLITAFATIVLVVVTIVYVNLLYNQTALQQDPILKINPGVWNIKGETPGIIDLELHNTGISDITNIRIYEDYFVPVRDSPLRLYRLGIYTVKEDQKIDYLKKRRKVKFRVKFGHLLTKMDELLSDKKGMRYKIVRIKIKFERELDRKEFEVNQIYIIAGNADILIKEDERDAAAVEAIPLDEIKRALGMN